MPWPTGTTTKNDTLRFVDRAAAGLKEKSAEFRARAAAGSVKADEITEGILRRLIQTRDDLAAGAAVPGIAAYAADARGVTQRQIVDAFGEMTGAINTAISWIATNLPKDAGGYMLIRQIDAQGAMTYRDFSPAQTAGLRTALQAVEATIA